MARHFEDIEFAVLTKEIDGKMVQRIVSGEAGESGQIRYFHDGEWTLVMHTHPPGGKFSEVASAEDMRYLKLFQQESSIVVLPDGTTFTFTQKSNRVLD